MIKFESNSAAVTQGSTDLIGSLNEMEINEE